MAATTSAPHPRIAELLGELEDARRELLAVVAELTPEQRDAPPAGDLWSVAEILEHLCVVEDSGGRLLSKLMKQAQANGAFEVESSSVLGVMDAFKLMDTTKRIIAPEIVVPRAGTTAVESLQRLAAIRERTVTALVQGSGLALGTVSWPHPLFGPLTGYQWILTIALHERRHAAQIRRQNGLA
jgi:DinB superfamily